MKNTVILLFLALGFISCKAQNIIVPIVSGDDYELNSNYYLKDVNNEFDKFVGEWKYENGLNTFVIKLKKEEHYQISDNSDYEDLLVGEYKYVENGVVKANTLSDFDNPIMAGYDHKISGGVFVHFLPSNCLDYSESQEIKVELFIEDPRDENIEGRLILRYVVENGIEKLQTCIYDYTTLSDDVNDRIIIPDGYYVFEKQ